MTTPSPLSNLAAWQTERARIRQTLWTLLGELPPLFTPNLSIDSTTNEEGYTLHHFTFDNGVGALIYGYLLIPTTLMGTAPAVLYHHVHGGKYEWGKSQLLQPHSRHGKADGIELVKRGIVVMGIDAYGFGERQHQGAAGIREAAQATEYSLFKQFLWQGSTLWGMIVRDDLLALAALLARPEIDPARVATTGMSLGGSRSTWVGALDERVALTIPISQMTRYANLLATGELARHSVYYYMPGMLKSGIDMEHIVALTAPRRQLILTGDSDPSSPIDGIHVIIDYAKSVYQLHNAGHAFDTVLYNDIDHSYTLTMHDAMIAAVMTL